MERETQRAEIRRGFTLGRDIRRFALLLLTALGLVSGARADDGYSVKCIHYYQDTAVIINTSASFVTPNGLLGGYTPGTTVTLTCDPKAITGLEHAAGYYVKSWDLDADWGDRLPFPGIFTPTHYRQYGAINPLTITFSSSELGFGPSTCELVPHIAMMHYTLAYDKNASNATGTAPDKADHYWSESVTAATAVFSRTGYTLAGWNTKADGSGVGVALGQTVSGKTFPVTSHNQAITLYAQWRANQYNIDLDAKDADPTPAYTTQISVTYDQTPETLSLLPKRALWKFDGYYTQADGTGEKYFDADGKATRKWQATDISKLYAKWVRYNCDVTFLVNGDGKISPSGSQHYDSGSIVVATAEPLEGAIFSHWSDGVTSFSRNIEIVSNATYTAYFTIRGYTLQFSYYNPDIEWVTVSQHYQHGDSVNPPTNFDNLPGYHSTHWDPTPPEIATKDGAYIMQYAGNQYVVAFDGNGADGGSAISGKTLTYGEKYTLPANTYSKTGYTFIGWNVDPNAREALYEDKEEVSDLAEKGKVTLYAIWSPNSYSVHFDGNGETGGSMADQNFIYDQVDELCANSFTRDGQTFLGWTDDQGRQYADGQVVSNLTDAANGTVTLKAQWSNYHYVAFDGMGATNVTPMAAQQFSGAETNALSANLYGKVGYTFAGWATNAVSATNLVVTYTNCQSASFPLAGPNETNWLYAVWATNRYTIAFDPGTNGVYGTMAEMSNCAYDTPITITCGYTNYCSQGLLGWSRTPCGTTPEYPVSEKSPVTQGSVAIVSNLTAAADGRVTLYAVWDGVGELSEAVGLSNAALSFECTSGDDDVRWHVVKNFTEATDHSPCIALESDEGAEEKSGEWHLRTRVLGPGTLRFTWFWEPYGPTEGVTFRVKVDNDYRCDLDRDTYWPDKMTIVVNGEGLHDIDWEINGIINNGSDVDKICLDDITWTPGAELKPGEATPVYATEAEAISAAELARVTPPNDEVAAVVSAEVYSAMFKVSAIPAAEAGKWTLVAELKDEVKEEVLQKVGEATAELSAKVTNNPVTVSVEMKPGLYYGLAGAADLASWSTASPSNWVLGRGGDAQALSMDKPEGTSAFYSIRVSLTPPITP